MQKNKTINDSKVKLIFVPLIGFLYPNVFGFINNHLSFLTLLLHYSYFILVSYIVWMGNSLLVQWIKTKIDIDGFPYHKYLPVIVLASFIASGFISFVLLYVWMKFSPDVSVTVFPETIGTIIFISIFISVIYETYILRRKKTRALSKMENLSFAKTQAELTALKNQIDPHFMFNSLNTLSYLISYDAIKAKRYNDTLAKVYQYILRNKDNDLVILKEELEFVSNYFYLLKIRFDDAIDLNIQTNNTEAEELLVPPISLQTLIENAIKHNEFSEENPLLINISVTAEHITVKNKINYKSYPLPASNIGLSNLANRYELITNKSIQIDKNIYFSVKLPVIHFKL